MNYTELVRRNQPKWALNFGSRRARAGRPADTAPPRWTSVHGHVVVLARPRLRYGHSSHGRSRYSHLVRHVWIAWRGGCPVLGLARWWCGGSAWSTTFELTGTPARPVCPKCRCTIRQMMRGPA